MTRVALAFSLMLGGALFVGQALVVGQALAQSPTTASTPAAQPKPGQTCKKIYVQKKSARTGTYVQVPRMRCF